MEENYLRSKVTTSLVKLKAYCEHEQFKGWDPYDGLNSKVFQALPLKRWDLARLAWIQGFKRSPINFRKLLIVPKGYNSKGIGLFLSGYCNLYWLAQQGDDISFGTSTELREKVEELAELLVTLSNKNYSGACWGYNFDWQARRLFLFPKNTPTVVATTFCASALMDAYEITENPQYLDTALSAAEFILNDLNKIEDENGIMLSYSPLNGNNTVFNASLLGAKLLSLCYRYTQKEEHLNTAKKIIQFACAHQRDDGSWPYGLLPVQKWVDSFHTGYNLEAIQVYQTVTKDMSFSSQLNKGFEFYLTSFFEENGTPKYYNNSVYPIDIHCPGQLFVTLNAMARFKDHQHIAERVMNWTIDHMQSKRGYFFYQIKKGVSSKISYMRWSNAFTFNAFSNYLLSVKKIKRNGTSYH